MTHVALIDCSRTLEKFNGDEIASYYYLKNKKNPYYYVVYLKVNHMLISIVENEDVAKDFCLRDSKCFYIKRRIQEKEIEGILNNYKIANNFAKQNATLIEESQKEANENFKKEVQKILDGVE